MLELPDLIAFDWDDGNRLKNRKHGVSQSEAEEVFFQYGSSGSSLGAGTRQGGRAVCISFVPSEATHTTADNSSNINNNINNNISNINYNNGIALNNLSSNIIKLAAEEFNPLFYLDKID